MYEVEEKSCNAGLLLTPIHFLQSKEMESWRGLNVKDCTLPEGKDATQKQSEGPFDCSCHQRSCLQANASGGN